MLKQSIQKLLNLAGLSMHLRSTVALLLADRAGLQSTATRLTDEKSALQRELDATLEERDRLRAEIKTRDDGKIAYATTEDFNYAEKAKRIVDGIEDFGAADFAQLACWLFASGLNNHKIIKERLDEGSLLWRAVKMSSGPILEVGRDQGGSTLLLLGASGSREVVSIDRAAQHSPLCGQAFRRPDVASRLKFHDQSSREPITETDFGLMFIDADHSYEGICHDIGTFWNTLTSFDGKPPIAVFHDGADNPITYVEPVKRACDELLAEPGRARVIESWGSMLVLEKLSDVDPDHWYAKDHQAFWEQYASPQYPVLKPRIFRQRLHPTAPSAKTAFANLLGTHNVDHDSWQRRGLEINVPPLNVDNPLRLLRETPEFCEHGVEKSVADHLSSVKFTAFVRPHHTKALRLSVLQPDRALLAHVDFELSNDSRIDRSYCKGDLSILDAGFAYQNGYFRCDLSIKIPHPLPAAIFAINALDEVGGTTSYKGRDDCGFWTNLFSVRDLLY